MSGLGPTIEELIKQSKKQSSGSSSSKQKNSSTSPKNGNKVSAKDYDSVMGKFQRKMKNIEIKEAELATQRTASQLGVFYIDLSKYGVPPEALSLIEEDVAIATNTLCFYREVKKVKVGSLNPTSPEVQSLLEDLKEQYHLEEIELFLISEYSYNKLIKQYKSLPKIRETVKGVEITESDLQAFSSNVTVISDLQKQLEKASVSQIVTAMVALSLQIDSSDIHVEAEEKDVKIRYRVDGILNDAATLKKKLWKQITTRIKLLSGLKLNVENKPQDGRFTIFLSEDKIDVRVSVIPTTYGESIVMRLLRSSSAGLEFKDLGIKGIAFERLKEEIKKPNGMIITTGPTGSGKTTTLYSVLSELNTPATKIITLEDPVEYKLEGVNQSQIDHSKGYNFADGLRSILRQDPDVVMVGEIRDLETGEVAINAALTGHLVVSTLHTNSASAAIPRFISMGVKPFLLSPALNAIIGQRLVRRVCNSCKIADELDTKTFEEIKKVLSSISEAANTTINLDEIKPTSFVKGGGCDECHGIGYRGRMGIYEILTINKEIEENILSGQLSEYVIQEIAVKNGMITMVQDGLLKALEGITTVEEVFRVAKTL